MISCKAVETPGPSSLETITFLLTDPHTVLLLAAASVPYPFLFSFYVPSKHLIVRFDFAAATQSEVSFASTFSCGYGQLNFAFFF